MKTLYLAAGINAIAAWPLFLVYTRMVIWPSANLGFVGGVQLVGGLLAAAMWHPTDGNLKLRERIASSSLIACAVAVSSLQTPIDGAFEQLVTLLAVGIAAAASTTLLLAVLERVHRMTDPTNAVRNLTIMDVVGSTSLQVGLLVGGLLVSVSEGFEAGLADPYRWYLLATASAVPMVMHRLRRLS